MAGFGCRRYLKSASPPNLRWAQKSRFACATYADRFNARDFDTLRNLLAEDVQLDLVNRLRLAGRKDVSEYFGRYGSSSGWKFTPGLADGHPALFVSNPADASDTVEYLVLLDWVDEHIQRIRDFRFAKYIMDGLCPDSSKPRSLSD